jgi:4-amino-4-deoxy-L-arabinose transferase-like glycosyltransferase
MIVLVILSFLSIWIIVGNSEREPDWRMAVIQAAIVWAGYLTLCTEILSLFHAINRLALSLVWSVPVLVGILWIWLRLSHHKILRLPIVYHRDSWMGAILDFFVLLILLITAIVAFVAPPNSENAMIYRMSRVAHWAQAQSLDHYATEIEPQNSNAPGAEIIQLNFYVLSGSDRSANMVAWLAFAGSVAAAASLAEVLGAKVNGQRMAAIFGATLPVAITQATSAMNDMVVTFWTLSAILMLLYYARKNQKSLLLLFSAGAAALAVVTKPTALIFLWPFALYAVVLLRQRLGMGRMLLWALTAFMFMGLINGGYFLRNQQDYGQFYRPKELAGQTNEVRDWRVLVSNITRNAALHADLPIPRADAWLKTSLFQLHDELEISVNDPRTTLGGDFYIPEVNTSERTSGNPLHAAIFVISFVVVVGMVILGKEDPDILVYSAALFFSLVLYCYLLKWQPTGGRTQLPFFFMFAPLVAFLLDKLEKFQLETAIAALLFAYSIPWLFETVERPVIVDSELTYPMSVFAGERPQLYFVTNPEDYFPYLAMAEAINALGIREIGLDLTDHSEEYPLWVLLGAPSEDLQIEWVAADPASTRLLDADFRPGAIICEECSAESVRHYDENYERIPFSGFDLFVKDLP